MRITIITACYNSVDFILDCIKSVLSQTYSEIEYIIVDGNSNDGSKEVIQRYEDKIAIFSSEPDRGVYDALNKGISMASGDVIGLLHADDLFGSSQTLQYVSEVFDPAKRSSDGLGQIDVVYGDLVFCERHNLNRITRYWKSEPFKTHLLKRGWMPPHPTVFMRREVYRKHGFFDTQLKCSADYDYILRVFSDETLTFHYLPEVITKMRMGGISTKGFRQIIRKKAEDYRVLKRNRMPFPLWVLLLKSLTKIPQLMIKRKGFMGIT